MRIAILCPAPPGSRTGNRVTAERWARILRGLGHRVRIDHEARPAACDLVIALHARRSAVAVARYRASAPAVPLVVALTGTDAYGDLPASPVARRTVAAAARIVVLQPLASLAVPPHLRRRVRVIRQSVPPLRARRPRTQGLRHFTVAVIAHLRPVKDPFRAALAVRGLPTSSRIRVVHAGGALTPGMERRARREVERNPRWRWVGERPRPVARRLAAASRVVILSSLTEGGAHVVSEAAVDGVPLLASRIAGTVGLLGRGYRGYFEPKDTSGLRALLLRAEREPAFLEGLRRSVIAKAPLFDERRERAAWAALLRELGARPR